MFKVRRKKVIIVVICHCGECIAIVLLRLVKAVYLYTRRPKLSFLRSNTVYCAKAVFCCLRVELENKENHHNGFQQQIPQRLVDVFPSICVRQQPKKVHTCICLFSSSYCYIGKRLWEINSSF